MSGICESPEEPCDTVEELVPSEGFELTFLLAYVLHVTLLYGEHRPGRIVSHVLRLVLPEPVHESIEDRLPLLGYLLSDVLRGGLETWTP